MEQVTAYKANDGKLFHTAADAQRHDNLKIAEDQLSDLLRSQDMCAHGQIDCDSFIDEVLSQSMFGRDLFKILSLVHSN